MSTTFSKKQTVFYISDGTGITAETIGHSVLCQFPNIEFIPQVIPYVRDRQAAYEAVDIINKKYETDGILPFVFDTLVDPEIRNIINTANAFNLDVFEGIISKISEHLNESPKPTIGRSHGTTDTANYKSRIDAVHFALDNDDGAKTKHYDLADVILVGVSRSGKTPTCLYLAMQYGIRAANYPITEEDLENSELPEPLKGHEDRLFGLLINTDRLVAIRSERRAGSRYASFTQCDMELRAIESIYQRNRIDYINVTDMSVEEIATRIIQSKGLNRRVGG